MNEVKILLVDDEEINRKIIMYSLTDSGYRFIEAENGLEAIERLEEGSDVSLIILDLMMPSMNGYEFLNWKKEKEDFKNIPVIVSSALTDMDNLVKTMKLGIYEYFVKPLQSNTLTYQLPLKIKNAIEFYRLYQSVYHQKEELERQKIRLEEELNLASDLQKSLLPHQVEEAENFKIVNVYRPIDELGGDFYDYYANDRELQLIIADVSGHGTSAALLTSALKSFYNNYLSQRLEPHELLKILNGNLFKILNDTDYYITALSLFIDFKVRKIKGSNAGHLYPILLKRKEKKLESHNHPSFFLGILDNQAYDGFEMEYDEGDVLFIFTDGLIEARNESNELFSLERLRDYILSYEGEDLEKFVRNIEEELRRFLGGKKMSDDYSIMGVLLK